MTSDRYKSVALLFFSNAFKTKKVLWHAQFSRKPYYDFRQALGTRVPNLKFVGLFPFFNNAFKTKKVLWQLPFAHARFSRKPYYDVRQVAYQI